MAAEFFNDEKRDEYLGGLGVELAGAERASNKDHAKAVKAEIDRVRAIELVENAQTPAAGAETR